MVAVNGHAKRTEDAMSAARIDGNRTRRAVKDLIADIDYVAKLTADEREWLEIFIDATAGNNMDAQAALAGTPDKFRKLYLEVSREHDRRKRDVLNTFARAPYKEQQDGEDDDHAIEALSHTRSAFFKFYRCTRCLSRPDKCDCPTRQRASPYGVDDYTPSETSEDTMISALDLKKRMQAYDLLPYGNNPEDLRTGHAVQICLPFHLFKDAWGYVLAHRPMDNSYLVDVRSKRGLRDRDGAMPETTTCWVKGEGLRRYRPAMVRT